MWVLIEQSAMVAGIANAFFACYDSSLISHLDQLDLDTYLHAIGFFALR